MAYNKIDLEFDTDVAIIRLNDPATLNAVTLAMIEELDDALSESERHARALVLTGSGRAFCSGANLSGDLVSGQSGKSGDMGLSLETHVNPLMVRLRNLSVPWVSAVRGAAAGVGCSLALAADLVIAGESAMFVQAFARVGLVPDGGSSWILSRSIGRTRAMEMMLLGEKISAAKAAEWGMINTVVRDEDLTDVALDLARRLASGPTTVLAMIRRIAWSAADSSFEEALATERAFQCAAGRTDDHAEGVAAFREKRTALFRGG